MGEIPKNVRHAILISAVFVFWGMISSILNPVQHHIWADAELLNAVGSYTIPACFGVAVYFIVKYYNKKDL